MTIYEKKQNNIFSDYEEKEKGRKYYNSSGTFKGPYVYNKKRDPSSFAVDWQMEDDE